MLLATSQNGLTGIDSFLVVELLSPLATLATNRFHAHHNPSSSSFLRALLLDALRRCFARSPPLTSIPPARPPLCPHSVQGLQIGLNNSKVPYIPGYLSNLSTMPFCSSTTQTTRNVHVRRTIDTTSRQQHPHPRSPCVFSVVHLQYWSPSS